VGVGKSNGSANTQSVADEGVPRVWAARVRLTSAQSIDDDEAVDEELVLTVAATGVASGSLVV
jgi:hypothetical protein